MKLGSGQRQSVARRAVGKHIQDKPMKGMISEVSCAWPASIHTLSGQHCRSSLRWHLRLSRTRKSTPPPRRLSEQEGEIEADERSVRKTWVRKCVVRHESGTEAFSQDSEIAMTSGVDEGSEFMSSVSSFFLLWMLLALVKINFRFSTFALQLVLISEDGVKVGAWGFNWIDVKFSCWCTGSGLCFSVVIHDELMRVEVWRISVSGVPSLGGNFHGRAVMLSVQNSS